MAFEIPTARIRQLQADLRREAGLPPYDPDDSPLPQLLHISEAVGALDPDLPASLCCGQCGGALLRGVRSILCIYCGADRSKEAPPYTISFNSTVGCRKLLDFLGLDGSEAVFLDSEPNGSKKRRERQKSGLVLSDLLELEIRWPSDKEEVVDDNTTATTPSPNMYALSSNVVDVDSFFSERNQVRLVIASERKEEVMPRKNTDRKVDVSYGSENFAAFEKLQGAETKSSFSGSNFGESFAVWNAEFLPASTNNTAVSSKSLDLFQDSSVRVSTPATTVEATAHQPENIDMLDEIGSKLNHPTTVNRQSEDDFWPIERANIDAPTLQKPKTHDGTSILDGISSKGKSDFNVQELWSTSNTKESGNTSHINPHDDPFDPWDDFTTSIEKRGSSNQGPETGSSLFENSFETSLIPESSKNEFRENKPVDGENNAVDDWQDFSSFKQQGSTSSQGPQLGVTLSGHSVEIKSVDPSHTSSKNGSDSLATIVSFHDSSDVWQEFAGSRETPEDLFNQKGEIGVTTSNDTLRTNSADPRLTSSINDLDKDKSSHSDDDWQDFTSFSNGPEISANLRMSYGPTLLEQPSEIKSVDSWPTKGETKSANGHNNAHDSSNVPQDFDGSRKTMEDLFKQESQTGVTSSKDSLKANSADPWPTSSINNLDKDKSLHGTDDSFADWQDFTSFSNGLNISANVGVPTGPTLLEQNSDANPIDSWPTKGETEHARGQDNTLVSSDVWQDSTGSRRTVEDSFNREGQTGVSSSKNSLGTVSVDLCPTSNISDLKNKSLHGDDDSFSDWQDFARFSKEPERSANVGTSSGPTLFEQPSETKAVSWDTGRKTESTNGHDDMFDDWKDFTSSIQVQQSSSVPGEESKISLSGHPTETNAVYQQGNKPYDFLRAMEKKKDYPVETDMRFASFSKKEADNKPPRDPNPLLWDTTATTKRSNANSNSQSEKSKVEKSASLPDLSFMLMDELSIPQKPSETSF